MLIFIELKVNEKAPTLTFLVGRSEGAAIHSNNQTTVQMNTVQTYVPLAGDATSVESTSVAPINPTLQEQLETLQNVALVLANPLFCSKYSYLATVSEQRLSQALGRVIGELDPLLIEALA